MDIPFLQDIAKQGLGYLLFVLMAFFYYRKDQKCQDLNDKRFQDWTQINNVVIETLNKVVNSQDNTQHSLDLIAQSVQDILLGRRKI